MHERGAGGPGRGGRGTACWLDGCRTPSSRAGARFLGLGCCRRRWPSVTLGAMARCRGEGPASVVGDRAHPLCEMFFTAESFNCITSTCLRGWTAGRLLLGLVADGDPLRRVVLVTEANVTYVMADLVACFKEDSRPGSWDWEELDPFASVTSPTGPTRALAPHRAKPGPAGDCDPQSLASGSRQAGRWGDAP